jgi:hypothetical protein
MAGYCRDKFKYHQAINGTFVRFLTRHMAGEFSMSLKATFDKLKAKVKALEADSKNKVSQEVFNRLDSKLTNILHLIQNIKQRKSGACAAAPAFTLLTVTASGVVRE